VEDFCDGDGDGNGDDDDGYGGGYDVGGGARRLYRIMNISVMKGKRY